MKLMLASVLTGLCVACSILVAPVVGATGGNTLSTEYYLSADDEGRSVLKTVEKYSFGEQTEFSKVLATKYEGHSVDLKIESLEIDGQGGRYARGNVAGGTEVKALQMTKNLTLTYTQRDVTKYVASQGENQFVWNIKSEDLKRDFASVKTTLYLGKSIRPTTKQDVKCVRSTDGSGDECVVKKADDKVEFSANNVVADENLSLKVGFTPGTFRGYQKPVVEKLGGVLLIIFGVIVVGGVASGAAVWTMTRRKTKRK
jgi:hypothetical protein